MSWQGICIFFAATWSIVGVIWLSTLGGKVARHCKIARRQRNWLTETGLTTAGILLVDWFSGYFFMVLAGQLTAGLLAFSLAFAIYKLVPSLKAPTGKSLASVVKLVTSPLFGPF